MLAETQVRKQNVGCFPMQQGRLWVIGVMLAVFAVQLAVVESAQALAVRVVNTEGQGVSARSAPRLDARSGYGAPEGSQVHIVCQTWGEPVGPRANRLWVYVHYPSRGTTFYMPDVYTTSPTVANRPIAGVGVCGQPAAPPVASGRAASAANFARARVGQVYASGADRAILVRFGADWTGRADDGPVSEWSGDCLRFANLAYYQQGVQPARAGTAQLAGDQYARAGRLRGGVPDAGALVFYGGARGFGHVGVSLGGGAVASTSGFDGARSAVRTHSYSAIGSYRGWVLP